MKEIPLSKGLVALVSDEDYDRLAAFKWTASRESRGTKWYAIRWSRKEEHGEGKRYKVRMHREVMGQPHKPGDGMVVDHVNGDGLDNRRENLELVSQSENMHRVAGWKGSRENRNKKETVCRAS